MVTCLEAHNMVYLQNIYPFKINSVCSMTFGYWLKYEIANIQLYLTYKNGNLFIKIFTDCVSQSNINNILFNFVS